MACVRISDGIISINEEGVLVVNGRRYAFDNHDYCGPTFYRKKDGQPWSPSEGHPVWKAYAEWREKKRSKK